MEEDKWVYHTFKYDGSTPKNGEWVETTNARGGRVLKYKTKPMNNGLKASELRPGNIVDMGFGPEPVNEYQIYQFSLYQLGAREPGYYKDWKPVELTKEILLGLRLTICVGPYYDQLAYKYGNLVYSTGDLFQKYEDHFHFITERKFPVEPTLRYAHELQNLVFFLTKKELDTTQFLEA